MGTLRRPGLRALPSEERTEVNYGLAGPTPGDPPGPPDSISQTGRSLRGGMVFRRFEIVFPMKTLALTTFTMPDGKLEQYLVSAAD